MNNLNIFETASAVWEKYQSEDKISRNIKIPILAEIVRLTFINGNEVPVEITISHPYWKSQVNTDLLISTVEKVFEDLSISMKFVRSNLSPDGFLSVTFTSK